MKWILTFVFLAGCASSGPKGETSTIGRVKLNNRDYEVDYSRETITKTHDVEASRANVWKALLETHDVVGLRRLSADSASAILAYEGSGVRTILNKRVSSYLDCGLGAGNVPRADSYSVTVHVDHKIVETTTGHSKLSTIVAASARNRSISSDVVQCTSNGTLENKIHELVAARL